MMKLQNAALHIVRVGTGITFVWIGLLVFNNPEGWGSMIQPWAANLLPFGIKEAMITTAILDIVIGFLLLIDVFTAFAALLGALHLASVLVVVGITPGTSRDIAILASTIALMVTYWPRSLLPGIQK